MYKLLFYEYRFTPERLKRRETTISCNENSHTSKMAALYENDPIKFPPKLALLWVIYGRYENDYIFTNLLSKIVWAIFRIYM